MRYVMSRPFAVPDNKALLPTGRLRHRQAELGYRDLSLDGNPTLFHVSDG